MPTLLRLDSSSSGEASVSKRLTTVFADAWQARDADHVVVARDLHADPVPHLPDASLHWPPRLRAADAPALPEADATQREVIDQLLAADVLLIGAPMYNYSLPSTLKTWLDHVHVPGVTAPFDGDTQPMRGRTAVIVTTRGATYDEGSPTATWDHVVPPLQIVLGEALGMRVEVVVVTRTLSTSVAGLAGERGAFEREYTAAADELRRLALALD
ncbi:FMN-dependent NADH-azoreductase [Gryllotalpicola reticulitermitis]|uniref:FMN dependent NADH:quinone oxidoreductase n=1 Tax=Gryllotalpicola reticulitermitis TaxID=1184153 RepID=A0ABV8Q2V4_9MICO